MTQLASRADVMLPGSWWCQGVPAPVMPEESNEGRGYSDDSYWELGTAGRHTRNCQWTPSAAAPLTSWQQDEGKGKEKRHILKEERERILWLVSFASNFPVSLNHGIRSDKTEVLPSSVAKWQPLLLGLPPAIYLCQLVNLIISLKLKRAVDRHMGDTSFTE
ncbi:uncharacterized protein LOC144367145 [Ictidomys tridecemlineatus]